MDRRRLWTTPCILGSAVRLAASANLALGGDSEFRPEDEEGDVIAEEGRKSWNVLAAGVVETETLGIFLSEGGA